MVTFRQFIERYTEVPDTDWLLIQQAFKRKEYQINEVILAEGCVCKYFYFLEEGLIRYYMLQDGNDITKFFTAAAVVISPWTDLTCSSDSYLTKKRVSPAPLNSWLVFGQHYAGNHPRNMPLISPLFPEATDAMNEIVAFVRHYLKCEYT